MHLSDLSLYRPEYIPFFHLAPSFLVDPDDLIHSHVVKVCAYSIETVVVLFFPNEICVKVHNLFCADLPVFCCFLPGDKPMRIVLIFWTLLIVSTVNELLCAFDLSVPNLSLVVFIFR